MSTLRELKREILQIGSDMRIDDDDWLRLRALLPAEGPPTSDDIRTLIELRTDARSVCADFDGYFFPAFKDYLLEDGKLSPHEQFQLVRLLYGGGGVDANEKRFLQDLRRELRGVTPEFDAMYQQAMRD